MPHVTVPPTYQLIQEALIANQCCNVLSSFEAERITYAAGEALVLLSNSTGKYAWGFIGRIRTTHYALLVIHCPKNEHEIITSIDMFNRVWSYEYFKPEKFYLENEFTLCDSLSEAIIKLSNMIDCYTQESQYPIIY